MATATRNELDVHDKLIEALGAVDRPGEVCTGVYHAKEQAQRLGPHVEQLVDELFFVRLLRRRSSSQ